MPLLSNSGSSIPTTDEKETVDDQSPKHITKQRGVYRITFIEKPEAKFSLHWNKYTARVKDIASSFPFVRRFLADVYSLGPRLLLALWIAELLQSAHSGVSLYLSNWLLGTIEVGVTTGRMDVKAVRHALIARGLLIIASSFLVRMRSRLHPMVENRAQLHFEFIALQATLSQDFATVDSEIRSDSLPRSINAWRTLYDLIRFFRTAIECASELTFLIHAALANNLGGTFLIVWMLRVFPVFEESRSAMWTRGCVFWANNVHYLHIQGLNQLATRKQHQQEVLGGDLMDYIIKGYSKARESLGDTPFGFHVISSDIDDPLWDIVTGFADDWPTFYYGLCALSGSIPFQFSTISSIRTASQSLRRKLAYVLGSGHGSFAQVVRQIKGLYASLEIKPDSTADANSYPDEAHENSAGMMLELRDVTFTYPSSKSSLPALCDVSFTIKPGQLVVIVGANGSGKTSLVKLLTRLYNPTSGDIMVDGQPASSFKLKDLRKATVVLSQDHTLFPLSILENIGLGRPDLKLDESKVQAAAVKGGAAGLVERLDAKYATVLHPVSTKGSLGVDKNHPLHKLEDDQEKRTDVSGGERQRLVASRTFMRLTSEAIKLAVVDEPSAAMDPAGEFELFKQLREERSGKTMIFITHRFGHLTKHADVILCMKEGRLVEHGTHEELLSTKGEYFDLYNVQAQAFTT